ncbi:MAG: hypothetical protein F6K09_18985 [Merismopedia sp. SIO2A8]|nr:hypothetical protein [Merismopedia sp. SIO2A8]
MPKRFHGSTNFFQPVIQSVIQSVHLDCLAPTAMLRVPWRPKAIARSFSIGSFSLGIGLAIATPSFSRLPSSYSLFSSPFSRSSSPPLAQSLQSQYPAQVPSSKISNPTSPADPAAPFPSPAALYPLGILRVSNHTYHPIRVALLPRLNDPTGTIAHAVIETSDTPPSTLAATSTPLNTPQYGDPIHWDFVPREGYEQGLVLALPEGQFQVQPGDIVTAFAQDGSRRYWGPYMVGVTDTPVWDEATGEWALTLELPFPF